MGAIYLSHHEQAALKAIDTGELERLVDQAIWNERTTALYNLNLSNCGPFVAERLRRFEQHLAEYAKSKSAKKRSETKTRATWAGSDLLGAARNMQLRMKDEEREALLFRIDDLISPPYRFSERIDVRVSYRWRRTVDDEWVHSSITFVHDVAVRPDYTVPLPKRTPSAAKQERDRQEILYKHWEHLMRLALHSVHGYLKSTGDGNAIPETFQVKTDTHSRWLNNFSCDFWQERS